MRTLSVDRQIAALRPARGFAAHMHTWFLAGAALGVVAAVVLRHPAPLMFSAFLAVVGLSERRAGPHLVAAVAAWDSGTPSHGEVSVAVTCRDSSDRCVATVREPGCPEWEYEFVPQGWRPAAGTLPARIWRAGTGGPPVLVVVEEGLMIPRHDPKRRDARGDGAAPA